ncbi:MULTISPECIES: hypothetical protein [Rahnella]|uniref:Uncharacterized protein n=1 Tax=Rahnella contaminans TaxID=2703882 RepID=A0A6M2B0B5_9GAMM|nr:MULTISPECIES: hypothetical protein [Rahnella]MBU9820475.1 hypothetical protein [Rahnella sp. BCC 1045]MCS3424791.1 hypothetical protein [Rahnella sp. BIGb0603]MDF1894751.1 hypothetical protein [Rahnella contaminans]NGX86696.1 hypothetical protein [Rahnella contaminans]
MNGIVIVQRLKIAKKARWLFNLARSSDFASFTLTIRCAFAKTSGEEEINCLSVT